MTTRTEFHVDTADTFLTKAYEYLADGDLLQASEKGWGATAQQVKAVAESRGWPHDSHRELYRIVRQLAQETDDERLRNLFRSANDLHQNFYEGRMLADDVEDTLKDVEEIMSRLRPLLAATPSGNGQADSLS